MAKYSTTSLLNLQQGRFKTMLLSCALGASVLGGAFAVNGYTAGYARAADEPVEAMQPVTGWAVSRVGDINTSGGYCALARRYSKSHVFTIAMNKRQEASLAFDFQRSLFTANKPYVVTLSSGSFTQEFDVMAQSTSGMVLKVGNNAALFDALKREQSLNLKIDGKNYRFALSNFSSGYDQLETCLGVKDQVIRQEMSRAMGAQVNMLRDQLSQLQAENETLLSQLEDERQKFRGKLDSKTGESMRVRELMDQLSMLEKSNTELMQRLQSEQSSNVFLKSNLDQAQADKTNADMSVQQAVKVAQQERDELQAMLNMEKQRRAEIEKIVSQKGNIEQQQAQLIGRIAELEKMNVELGVQLDQEVSERRRIEQQLKNAAAERPAYPADYKMVVNENKELREKLATAGGADEAAIRQSLEETREELDALKGERDHLMSMLERERAEFSEYMKQEGGANGSERVQQLSSRLRNLEQQNSELFRRLQEKTDQLARITSEDGGTVEDVARSNMAAGETREEIARLKKMLAMERDERMRLARAMADAQRSGTSVSDADMNLSGGFEDRIASLEAENRRLRSALEGGQMANGEVAPEALQEAYRQIEEKKQLLELVSAERDELKALLQQERRRRASIANTLEQKKDITNEKTDLSKQLRALEARNMELARALEMAKKNVSPVRNVKEVVARPPMMDDGRRSDAFEIAQIKNELEIALAERDEYRSLLQEERSRLREVQSLRRRIGSVSDDQASLNQTVRDLQQEKVELIRALEYERAKLDALPADDPRRQHEPNIIKDQAAEEQIEMLKAERDALRRELSNGSSVDANEIATLERMIAQARKDEAEMQSQIRRLEQEKQQLNSLLSNAQKNADVARKDVAAFAEGKDEISSAGLQSSKDDTQRLMMLEEENRRLYSEMKALKAQKSEIEAMEAELVSLKAQNGILREEIAVKQKNASQVVADEDMVAHLRGTIDRLSMQNQNLQEALEISRQRELKKSDNSPYRQKLMDAQTRIQAVMAENASLARELEKVRLDAENSIINGQQESLDVQQARVRYQEAEREIDRLSDILRAERQKHEVEVAELEEKLFDPAITEAEQLKHLQKLEAEIRRLRDIDTASGGNDVRDVAEVEAVRPRAMPEAPVQGQAPMISNTASQNAPAAQSSVSRLRERIAAGQASQEEVISSYARSPHYKGSRVEGQVSAETAMAPVKADARVDFQPAPQAQPVPAQPQMNSAPAPMGEPQPAPAPMPQQAQAIPQGALNGGMAPIMDGPGEEVLASAVQQGGGVFVSERQVPVQAPMAAAPASAPMPQQVAQPQPMQMQQAMPTPVPSNQQASLQMPAQPQIGNIVNTAPQQAVMSRGPNGQDIASMLVQAGIPMVNGFERVESVSNPTFSAFRWDTGSVYGSAEKTVMTDPSQFQNYVDGYLRKTQARCTGSFDKTLSASKTMAGMPMMTYDIACVGGDMQGAGAALIFYAKDNTFNVIAHEAGIESFDQAMTTRDVLADTLIR